MRFRRAMARYRMAMLVGCACMAAFYGGRLSAGKLWTDLIVLVLWVAWAGYWLWEIHRESRREEAEFMAEMRKVAGEIARKQFQGEE